MDSTVYFLALSCIMGLMSKKMKVNSVFSSSRVQQGATGSVGYVSMGYVMHYKTCYQTSTDTFDNAVCFVSVHLWFKQQHTVSI